MRYIILERKKKREGKKEREPNPNIVVAVVVNGCVTAARFRSKGRACSLFHSQISGTAIEHASYLHGTKSSPRKVLTQTQNGASFLVTARNRSFLPIRLYVLPRKDCRQ